MISSSVTNPRCFPRLMSSLMASVFTPSLISAFVFLACSTGAATFFSGFFAAASFDKGACLFDDAFFGSCFFGICFFGATFFVGVVFFNVGFTCFFGATFFAGCFAVFFDETCFVGFGATFFAAFAFATGFFGATFFTFFISFFVINILVLTLLKKRQAARALEIL